MTPPRAPSRRSFLASLLSSAAGVWAVFTASSSASSGCSPAVKYGGPTEPPPTADVPPTTDEPLDGELDPSDPEPDGTESAPDGGAQEADAGVVQPEVPDDPEPEPPPGPMKYGGPPKTPKYGGPRKYGGRPVMKYGGPGLTW